jgi:hypothetical protein
VEGGKKPGVAPYRAQTVAPYRAKTPGPLCRKRLDYYRAKADRRTRRAAIGAPRPSCRRHTASRSTRRWSGGCTASGSSAAGAGHAAPAAECRAPGHGRRGPPGEPGRGTGRAAVLGVLYTDFTELVYARGKAWLMTFVDHASKVVPGRALGPQADTTFIEPPVSLDTELG